MAIEDNESCGSRAVDLANNTSGRHQRKKLEVYNEVLRRLKESNNYDEALQPGFDDQLWAHFNRLPTRYALDVNVERAEDVLTHKRLLHLAHDPANRPAFEVRLVQVAPVPDENYSVYSGSAKKEVSRSVHPPPAFGSSPNPEALACEVIKSEVQDEDEDAPPCANSSRPMHEITFSMHDKPKLLSKLTSLLAELGLNIQEAHAFSTVDGYSLDVFVVDGWPYEEVVRLRTALESEILRNEKSWPSPSQSLIKQEQDLIKCEFDHLTIPFDGIDVWEIDHQLLKFEYKIASGSYGDLYKGTYCSQEVAIKILKSERLNTELQTEFGQEVYIMRKVRHKNVVQFIGACTRPPNLCIVTEYMSGGSVYDYLHKQRGSFKLPTLLKVAIDVSKGMNYLHQNNIIHRDLKAANLLMDENEYSRANNMKEAYFLNEYKVAIRDVTKQWRSHTMPMVFIRTPSAEKNTVFTRVKAQTGVMTAETGTYRWMAPEVIEHKPYDHKADVFSFGVVLWELLTGKLPYEYLTPLQAAIGVVQKGLRPTIPKHTPPELAELLATCWQQDPTSRPDFSEIVDILQQIAKEVGHERADRCKEKSAGGFFSSLRRGHH